MLDVLSTGFKTFMDIFGTTILVPIVVFILSLILKVKVREAFRAAIFMAIGLTAFGLILGILYGQTGEIMSLMSANVGKTLTLSMSAGLRSVIRVQYTLGMFYLVIGLAWNVVLFTQVTDTFEPTDIWNYYFFCSFACCLQF